MAKVRIAQAQINSTVGDLKGNVAKIGFAIKRAREAGADLVTLPELAVCGYPPEDLLMRPQFLVENTEAIKEVAKLCEGIAAIVGFADYREKKAFNAAALIHDGRIKGVYHKIELPNYGVFDEKRYFTPGDKPFAFELMGVRFAVVICEDIWVPGGGAEKCASGVRPQIVVNISASPFNAGKLSIRMKMISGFAKRAGAFMAYNNLVGGQDELVFDGGSLVVDTRGRLRAAAKRFEEDMLVSDIEIKKKAPRRQKDVIILEAGKEADRAPVKDYIEPELNEVEEIYRALVLGTRDYLHKNGFEKAVIGLSGGIDSSLVAALAAAALGPGNVVGVTMPSRYTSEETRSDAVRLAENLNIRLITSPLERIFKAYIEELEEPFGEGDLGIEAENLQARIRGNILMALSNRFGWLVLTTGNKSETATGYCTLYGDMAGGFAVIKDVPKMMVYKLSELVNEKDGREVIPASIIERAPTAELRPGQKDEDSLPPYKLLDAILHEYVEEDKSIDQIAAMGFDKELIKEVVRLVDRAEFKRRQAPPGIKITPKAFGRDRRMPITNRFRH